MCGWFFGKRNKVEPVESTPETEEEKSKREQRRDSRSEARDKRKGWRIEKIKAATAKAYAVATKRKWLVFMMALGIAIYFIISSGGGSSILNTVKSFLGG